MEPQSTQRAQRKLFVDEPKPNLSSVFSVLCGFTRSCKERNFIMMNIHNIKDSFWRIGAKVSVEPRRGPVSNDLGARIAIGQDEQGQYFRMLFHPLRVQSLEIADIRPGQRKLLAVFEQRSRGNGARNAHARAERHRRFLCGRDEQGLFAFALPEWIEAHNVRSAVEALDAELVSASIRNERRNIDRLKLALS